MEETHYHPGARNVVIAKTSVCSINGEKGELAYRGYRIQDLSRYCSYEDVCFLLLYGELPRKNEKRDFSRTLAIHRGLPRETIDLIERRAYRLSPIDLLISVANDLKMIDPDLSDISEKRDLERGIKLIASLPTALAVHDRLRHGLQPLISFLSDYSHAENFLYMLRGVRPKRNDTRALDKALIIHADHEFNNSTTVARTVVSTKSDLYSGVIAAMCSLKGPLHGGANQEVSNFVQMLENQNIDDVEEFVRQEITKGKRIPGLGHAVYRVTDPRAHILEREVVRLLNAGREKEKKIYEMLKRIRRVVAKEKGRYPNVDFYSVVLYQCLGLKPDMAPALFEISRIVGQIAHILEQRKEERIIRPIAEYNGPPIRPYKPSKS